jgi:hypothetical protein
MVEADYSRPLSYSSIENSMRHALDKMEELTMDYAVAIDDFNRAEAAYKGEFISKRVEARLVLDVGAKKVTVDMVDDYASSATRELYYDMKIAEAKYEATLQSLRSVRSRLEALRSLMASYREQGA